MTFSLLARDDEGAFGAVIASSSPAVAARCIWLRDGVGAVATQNITDPRLGARGLDLLAAGSGATDVVTRLAADDPTARFRQLLVVDSAGHTASWSGSESLGTVASAEGTGVVAAGNLLAGEGVPAAMVAGFEQAGGHIEERLLTALRAGAAAGGEAGPIRSCGLAVVTRVGWRVTDLRIDWHDDPVRELERLLAVWLPQRDDYVARAVAPERSPGYGVPGDDRP